MKTYNRANNLPKDRDWEKNSRWKGGVIKRTDGYVMVNLGSRPKGWKGSRYKLMHRLVMEEHLGRPLLRKEIVHHKNHIKGDNRVENLEVITQAEHAAIHYHTRKKNTLGQFQ